MQKKWLLDSTKKSKNKRINEYVVRHKLVEKYKVCFQEEIKRKCQSAYFKIN